MAESAVDYGALQAKVRELEGSVLIEAKQSIEKRFLELRFKHWDGRSLAVCCNDVVLCNVSALDQDGSDPEVIGARLEVLESGASKVLEQVGYLWEPDKTREERFSYPLVHLSIEGDTCVAVVCGAVDFC
jgi:hypothetical protein